jgi:hypothetical protein
MRERSELRDAFCCAAVSAIDVAWSTDRLKSRAIYLGKLMRRKETKKHASAVNFDNLLELMRYISVNKQSS